MHHLDGDCEERVLRERLAALEDEIDALPARLNVRTPVLVGTVFAETALPTNTLRFFAVHPTKVSGVTAENAVATLTPDTSRTEYFRVIGNKVPDAGDALIGRHVDHRWQAERYKITTTVTVCPGHALGGNIQDCAGFGLVGATVTVVGTGGTYTTTSGLFGSWGVAVPDGTFTVTASFTGYDPKSASATVAGCVFTSVTIRLDTPAADVCCEKRNLSGTQIGGVLTTKTKTLTTPIGSCSLSWSLASGWTGTLSYSAASAYNCNAECTITGLGAGTVTVFVGFDCSGRVTFHARASAPPNDLPIDDSCLPCDTCFMTQSVGLTTPVQSPYSASGTLASSWLRFCGTTQVADITGIFGGTVTVTD